MELTKVRRSLPIAAILVMLGATALTAFQAGARAQAQAPAAARPTQTVVLDNARVQVRHILFPPNTGLDMHSVGTPGDKRYDVMIQLTPAKLEGQVDEKKNVSDKAGNIWEIPGAPSQHAFRNLSDQPIEVMVVGEVVARLAAQRLHMLSREVVGKRLPLKFGGVYLTGGITDIATTFPFFPIWNADKTVAYTAM